MPASTFSAVPPHVSLAATRIPHQPVAAGDDVERQRVRRLSLRVALALPAAGDVGRCESAAGIDASGDAAARTQMTLTMIFNMTCLEPL